MDLDHLCQYVYVTGCEVTASGAVRDSLTGSESAPKGDLSAKTTSLSQKPHRFIAKKSVDRLGQKDVDVDVGVGRTLHSHRRLRKAKGDFSFYFLTWANLSIMTI